jgi:hypothetical protein
MVVAQALQSSQQLELQDPVWDRASPGQTHFEPGGVSFCNTSDPLPHTSLLGSIRC